MTPNAPGVMPALPASKTGRWHIRLAPDYAVATPHRRAAVTTALGKQCRIILHRDDLGQSGRPWRAHRGGDQGRAGAQRFHDLQLHAGAATQRHHRDTGAVIGRGQFGIADIGKHRDTVARQSPHPWGRVGADDRQRRLRAPWRGSTAGSRATNQHAASSFGGWPKPATKMISGSVGAARGIGELIKTIRQYRTDPGMSAAGPRAICASSSDRYSDRSACRQIANSRSRMCSAARSRRSSLRDVGLLPHAAEMQIVPVIDDTSPGMPADRGHDVLGDLGTADQHGVDFAADWP